MYLSRQKKNEKERRMYMNGEKILNSIQKLQQLDEKSLDLVSSAIDSCLVVQAMEQANKNPLASQRFAISLKA